MTPPNLNDMNEHDIKPAADKEGGGALGNAASPMVDRAAGASSTDPVPRSHPAGGDLERAVDNLVRHVDGLERERAEWEADTQSARISKADRPRTSIRGDRAERRSNRTIDGKRDLSEQVRANEKAIAQTLQHIKKLSTRALPPDNAWQKLEECHTRLRSLSDVSEKNAASLDSLTKTASTLTSSTIEKRLNALDDSLAKISASLKPLKDDPSPPLSTLAPTLEVMQARLDSLHAAMPEAGFVGFGDTIKALADKLDKQTPSEPDDRFTSLEGHLTGLVNAMEKLAKGQRSLKEELAEAGPRSDRLITVLDAIGAQLDRLPRERPATAADLQCELDRLAGALLVRDESANDGPIEGWAANRSETEGDRVTTDQPSQSSDEPCKTDAFVEETGDDGEGEATGSDLSSDQRHQIRASVTPRHSFGQRMDPSAVATKEREEGERSAGERDHRVDQDPLPASEKGSSWIAETLLSFGFLGRDQRRPGFQEPRFTEPDLLGSPDLAEPAIAECADGEEEAGKPGMSEFALHGDQGFNSGASGDLDNEAGPILDAEPAQFELGNESGAATSMASQPKQSRPSDIASFDLGLSKALGQAMERGPEEEPPEPVDLLALARRAAQAAAEEASRDQKADRGDRSQDDPGRIGAVTKSLGMTSLLAAAAVAGAVMMADGQIAIPFNGSLLQGFQKGLGSGSLADSEHQGQGAAGDSMTIETPPITTGSIHNERAKLPGAEPGSVTVSSGGTDDESSFAFAFSQPHPLEPGAFGGPALRDGNLSDMAGADQLADWHDQALEDAADLTVRLEDLPGFDDLATDGDSDSLDTPAMPKTPEQAAFSEGGASRLSHLADVGESRLREMAEAGDPLAQFTLAENLTSGQTLPLEDGEEIALYEKSARSGFARAQYALATLYESGRGLARNPKMAAFWYQEAAEGGHAKAMHNLAVLNASGVEGEPDLSRAAYWFERAAEEGIHDSQFNLGILYAKGAGVPLDIAAAYKWFALAALSGDEQAATRRDALATNLASETRVAIERDIAQLANP